MPLPVNHWGWPRIIKSILLPSAPRCWLSQLCCKRLPSARSVWASERAPPPHAGATPLGACVSSSSPNPPPSLAHPRGPWFVWRSRAASPSKCPSSGAKLYLYQCSCVDARGASTDVRCRSHVACHLNGLYRRGSVVQEVPALRGFRGASLCTMLSGPWAGTAAAVPLRQPSSWRTLQCKHCRFITSVS